MSFAADTLALIVKTFGSTDAFLERFSQYSRETKRMDDIMKIIICGRDFTFKMFGGFNTVAVKVKDPKDAWVTVFEFNDH
jgi:hypothetical protein